MRMTRRLAAGAGAGVAGPVGVDERDASARLAQVVRRPGAEDPGADDGHVVGAAGGDARGLGPAAARGQGGAQDAGGGLHEAAARRPHGSGDRTISPAAGLGGNLLAAPSVQSLDGPGACVRSVEGVGR